MSVFSSVMEPDEGSPAEVNPDRRQTEEPDEAAEEQSGSEQPDSGQGRACYPNLVA